MRPDTSSLLLCAALCLPASARLGRDVEPPHNRRLEAHFAKLNVTIPTEQPEQQAPDSQPAESSVPSSLEAPVSNDPPALTTSSPTATPVVPESSSSLVPQIPTTTLEQMSSLVPPSSQIQATQSTRQQISSSAEPYSSNPVPSLSSSPSSSAPPSSSSSAPPSSSSHSTPSIFSSSPSQSSLLSRTSSVPDGTSASSLSSSPFSTLSHNNSTTLQSQTRSVSSTSKSKPHSKSSKTASKSRAKPTSKVRNGTEGSPTGVDRAPERPPSGFAVTTITCGASSNESACAGAAGTVTVTTRTCTPLPKNKAYTVFSVVHTSTVTLMGNSTSYSLPYEPLVTPDYCDHVMPRPTNAGSHRTARPTLIVYSSGGQEYTSTSIENAFGLPSLPIPLEEHSVTATAIITDKNPAVETTPDPVPTRTNTDWPGGQVDHKPPEGDHPQGVNRGPFIITAGTKTVIINQHTYTDIGAGQTRIVTVDNGAVFTIGPTGVVGEGASVSRPTPDGQPTPTNVGGIPVTVQPSNIVIGGGTFAIPTAPTTALVNGSPVVIGPDSVSINGDTYSFSRPGKSNFVIAGGELMTAIGKSVVVLHSTTYTYGPGSPAVKSVVNDDTVLIGPTDVSVHGSAMGGPAAEPGETDYEIVGAATIGKLPPSMFVINSKTYAVGPDAGTSTVVIGDQTITLGPNGLVLASRTMSYPFNAQVVTTIPGTSNEPPMPERTGSDDGDDDEEDAAFSVRPDRRVGIVCLCIAIGAWVLG